MAKAAKRDGLVYTTDAGRMCPGCRRPLDECVCRDLSRTRSAGGAVIVGRETKGRKGAGVTVIRGLALADGELKRLAARLKSSCGVGGSVKAGVIELQGDQRDRVLELLAGEGITAKKSGG